MPEQQPGLVRAAPDPDLGEIDKLFSFGFGRDVLKGAYGLTSFVLDAALGRLFEQFAPHIPPIVDIRPGHSALA
jgi:hypothetical protein